SKSSFDPGQLARKGAVLRLVEPTDCVPCSILLFQENPTMNKNGMTDVGAANRTIDEKLDSLKHTVKDVVDQGAQRAEEIKSRLVGVKDEAMRRGGDAVD